MAGRGPRGCPAHSVGLWVPNARVWDNREAPSGNPGGGNTWGEENMRTGTISGGREEESGGARMETVRSRSRGYSAHIHDGS